jgi:MYXO-CTERM domain-containing protein
MPNPDWSPSSGPLPSGPRRPRRWGTVALVIAGSSLLSSVASAATYYYVDWTTADVAHGTASGVINVADAGMVTVQFAALTADGGTGNLYGAQVGGTGTTNYWNPSTPYISTEVENPPPGTDILQLSGGQDETYRVTLSEAIKDPIMAIVSLGAVGTPTTYDFDSPFTIVSQGVGYFGGGDAGLQQLPDDVLQGTEGHGTIQFIGTFSTFSWTVPTPETWHGFTFGIRTTEALEPTPDAGPDAGDAGTVEGGDAGVEAGSVDAGVTSEAGPDAGSLDAAAPPTPDAAAPVEASTPDEDAEAVSDATVEVPDAGGGVPPSPGAPPSDSSCGCSTVGADRTTPWLPWLAMVGMAGLVARRVRANRRAERDHRKTGRQEG